MLTSWTWSAGVLGRDLRKQRQTGECWEAFREGIIGELGQKDNPLVT